MLLGMSFLPFECHASWRVGVCAVLEAVAPVNPRGPNRARTALLDLRRGEQAVADAEDGLDVAGAMSIVAELPAQATEVSRERVVSDLGVGPAQCVGDLAIADNRAGPSGEGIQEDVLARRKRYLARALANASVQSIKFKIGDPKGSHAAITPNSIARQRDQHRLGRTCSHDEPVISASGMAREILSVPQGGCVAEEPNA
jgi:hypothetical protein